ncbi:MAG: LptF/LptG family permease [candidate division Zixibacteria bacterium]|nr:LptF/LptG family permease [candidate division Zixibacteria bacterium]
MSLVTRYILVQFLSAAGVAMLAFVGIFYIVDLISQLDKFLDLQVEARYIVLYYLYFLPYIVVLTLPVGLLLACLFTFGQLGKYGELTAMKASGISLFRIFRPMLMVGVLVSLGLFAAGEWLVPETNRRRAEINLDHVERYAVESREIRNHVFYRGEEGRQYFLRLYNGYFRRASDVTVLEFREGAIVKVFTAREMEWEDGGWRMRDGSVRTFHPRGALIAAAAFDSLACPAFAERPEDFRQGQKLPEAMTYGELKRYIANVQRSGGDVQGYLVDLNLKLAFPCANLIIVLFGAALASHVRRSGAAFGFAASVGICFVYWGFLRFAQALGHAGTLGPLEAAWGPNAVFGLLGLLLFIRAPR